jgi:hypothetical protein
MEGGGTPLPVRGLALALVLGIVLAVAFVGVFSRVPASVELTGASEKAATSNQTAPSKTNETSSQAFSSANETSTLVAVPYFLGNSSNSLPIGAVSQAIYGGRTSNSTYTTGGNSSDLTSPSPALASQERSAVAAAGLRDILLFVAAGALGLVAFFVVRRYAS